MHRTKLRFNLPAMLCDVTSDGTVREAVQELVDDRTRAAHLRMRETGTSVCRSY